MRVKPPRTGFVRGWRLRRELAFFMMSWLIQIYRPEDQSGASGESAARARRGFFRMVV
jgi:hypothetical protein